MIKKGNKGFSAVELIISIIVLAILLVVTVQVFTQLSNSTSLERDAQSVLSLIVKARTMSINSVGGSEHGVKFSANKVEVFSGTSYNASNVKSSYDIPAKHTITAGIGEVFFHKLSGDSSGEVSYTVTISPVSGGGGKTIVIYSTGVSEIQ